MTKNRKTSKKSDKLPKLIEPISSEFDIDDGFIESESSVNKSKSLSTETPPTIGNNEATPSNHQNHHYLKAALQIIGIAFASIFGFYQLVEMSLKDVKHDIRLLECKNDVLMECQNKCNLQQVVVKQNACKNSTK